MPTLWRVLPAIEELQTAWEAKLNTDEYALYKQAISDGLGKLQKYYSRIDKKPVYIFSLLVSLEMVYVNLTNFYFFTVLHPYYKLDYIELTWGGAEEQKKEFDAGNHDAKNWKDEARKVIEKTVSHTNWYEVMTNCVNIRWTLTIDKDQGRKPRQLELRLRTLKLKDQRHFHLSLTDTVSNL